MQAPYEQTIISDVGILKNGPPPKKKTTGATRRNPPEIRRVSGGLVTFSVCGFFLFCFCLKAEQNLTGRSEKCSVPRLCCNAGECGCALPGRRPHTPCVLVRFSFDMRRAHTHTHTHTNADTQAREKMFQCT